MDFQFLHDAFNKQWTIFSPRRATRPDELAGFIRPCPFCPAGRDPALLDNSPMVIDNKFPFAPIHKIVIHSTDHKKNFDKLPLGQTETIFKTYQKQYNLYKEEGNVVIFHNYGSDAGASVVHPHSQIAVIPKHINLDVPVVPFIHTNNVVSNYTLDLGFFFLLCPQTSQWPDEVWIIPSRATMHRAPTFGDITQDQLRELSHIVARVIQLLDMRHGTNFSFNFYIAPWQNWYIRIIPRLKKPGGFELATGVYVNTQDPRETLEFLKENFHVTTSTISDHRKAKYHRGV